jgi:hypothetical protein
MNVGIGNEAAKFLFWEGIYWILGLVQLMWGEEIVEPTL